MPRTRYASIITDMFTLGEMFNDITIAAASFSSTCDIAELVRKMVAGAIVFLATGHYDAPGYRD